MNNNNNILALDQASITSGYAVFSPKGELITYGKFTFNDTDVGDRLVKIRNKIIQLVQDNDIGEVIMEDIQLQQNVQMFKVLAEVFGVVYETLEELNIPNSAVLASTWKSALGIKGKDRSAQKRNAQQYIINTYGVKPTQDECDAICIGKQYVENKPFDWS